MRYALQGGENILGDVPNESKTTDLGEWTPRGGHRLWAAPESLPRSYAPDNDPVDVEEIGERACRLTQQRDATGLAKEMEISIDPHGSGVTIEHRITNQGLWGIDIAAWALTIMRGGGTTIIPQEPYRSHDEDLLPARPLVLWHYTDLADPRWTLGPRLIRLRCDETRSHPQKIGVGNRQGWAAYSLGRLLFVKRFAFHDDAEYPDMGCNTEAYTAGSFTEVESLGPITHLEPGRTVSHRERWSLHDNVVIGDTDDDIAAALREALSA
jgi:hypothetical protein